MSDLVIRSRRVLQGNSFVPASVHVVGGRIVKISAHSDAPSTVLDAGDACVMPGVVDCHVHVNEPGRTEWEGFETATRAAAAGGITTIVDMPLNSDPVTTTVAALRAKEAAAAPRCWVDYAFWGGVIPGNENELAPLVDLGLPGFKCFLVHSGIDDFPNVTEKELSVAMPILARKGVVLLVHAEVPGPIDAAAREVAKDPKNRYATFLASRPRSSEDLAIELMVKLCRETGCRVHIVHLSSADSLATLAEARKEGLPITAETCPHYLTFTAEEVPDGATHFKCCPPIREKENRERLWAALREGVLDMVVSDHSPCPPAMKKLETGDFTEAWGGISALQLSLALTWTGAKERGIELPRLVDWMCRAPARLAGVADRKGDLAVGKDGDLIVFHPEKTFTPQPATIHHRHKLSPAAGRPLLGVVEATFVRGQRVWGDGRFTGPAGIYLRGGAAATAFTELVDLAAERVGGAALWANDEFFAGKENLLKPGRGEFDPHAYTDRGKLMDGWESRRKRVPGHDSCIIKLGVPGTIRGLDVDTNHFKGNFPEACSLDACALEGDPTAEEVLATAKWTEVLPRTTLQGHSQNLIPVKSDARWTHVRLNIYPDGGVARLRVYGEAVPDWRRLSRFHGDRIDLAAIEHGGSVIACNDMFFGSRHNLIMPGRAVNMGDGWETKRKRKLPGSDWVIVKLGAEGTLASIEVDTNHFKGNFPESCLIEGANAGEGATVESLSGSQRWTTILPRTKLRAHTRHYFDEQLLPHGTITHVRLSIFPDGGVSRLRLYGTVSAAGFARAALRRLNTAGREEAHQELLRCCGSNAWAARMTERRPFHDEASLLGAADAVWNELAPEDWHEAFRAHPRIGSKKDLGHQSGQAKAWAEGEQAGARDASSATTDALAAVNADYEKRFGHIYIVCATGKTAEEMLAIARGRLANDPAKELGVAAAEQAKITKIRLRKLLSP